MFFVDECLEVAICTIVNSLGEGVFFIVGNPRVCEFLFSPIDGWTVATISDLSGWWCYEDWCLMWLLIKNILFELFVKM
jgi:hypothetical protein